MDLSERYAGDIHRDLHMYAAWPVDTPLALGDYGTLEGKLFQKIGNIKEDHNIIVKSLASTASVSYDYRTSGIVKTALYAKGEVKVGTSFPLAKAGLDINFSGENAVFFNASGCKITSIENKESIFSKILQLYRSGKWNKEYRLITELVNAESTIIIASKSSNASISLEADSPAITVIDLAKAKIGLNLVREEGIGLKVFSDGNLTPLRKLAGIVDSFLSLQGPRLAQFGADDDLAEPVTIQIID